MEALVLQGFKQHLLLSGLTHRVPVTHPSRTRLLKKSLKVSLKYFATADWPEQMKDRNWLVRVTNTIYTHWQGRNVQNRNRCEAGQVNGQLGPLKSAVHAGSLG